MNRPPFDFDAYKYGIFVHYVHGISQYSNGNKPADLNETLDAFDVDGFAEALAAMAPQYLIFTAWHANMIPLYPSAVNAAWRGLPLARRDLLGEIIDAVNAKGIAVILYTHPRDGHDFSPEHRLATGWGEGHRADSADKPDPEHFDGEKWNAYVRELYTELADRYAHRIYGFYTDGIGPQDGRDPAMENNLQVVDYLMLRHVMKSANPRLIMIQNYFGYLFSNDYAMPEGYFGAEKEPLLQGGTTLPAAQKSLAMSPFAQGWWPSAPRCEATRPAVDHYGALRFLLFNASCTVGGGVCYATGPYCEGSVWPTGHLEFFKALGESLAPYRTTALQSKVSLSYPTPSGATLEDVGHRFFFTSENEGEEYLFLTQMQREIALPESQDGATLLSPESLTEGVTVEGFDGKTLRLSGDFDQVAAVIRFERQNSSPRPATRWINDTDKRIRYDAHWKYHHLTPDPLRQAITKGCFESDLHRALADGATAFLAFEGSFLELYGRGEATVYVDGIPVASTQGESCDLLCRTPNLHGGWHTLYVLAKKDFDLDALKIEE